MAGFSAGPCAPGAASAPFEFSLVLEICHNQSGSMAAMGRVTDAGSESPRPARGLNRHRNASSLASPLRMGTAAVISIAIIPAPVQSGGTIV